MLDLKNIYAAQKRLENIAVNTPLAFAPYLSELSQTDVYLKKENLQLTGSFKVRGAYNKVASLTQEELAGGVIAASAGNHAQGVAFAASKFQTNAVIVMPESTPLTKVNGVKYYGAEVILAGANYDEAYSFAIKYAQKHSLSFIHPFEDSDVIAGQGTVALEILQEIEDFDAIVIPVGGGGLISGMAKVIKTLHPHIKVIGVGALGAPAFQRSFVEKKVCDSLSVKTIADGIAVRDTSSVTLSYALESVDEIISVDDEEIASAMLFLLEKQKLVIEGAGSVGVAALLHHKLKKYKNKKIAIVLSGGNVDVTLLSIIIEKGLLKSGRKMKLTVTLIDKPGSLKTLTKILEDVSANIVHISYDRTSISLNYGDADVTIHLETKGEEHQRSIYSELEKYGYILR